MKKLDKVHLIKASVIISFHQSQRRMFVRKSKPILSLSIAFVMMLGILLTSQAASAASATSRRIDELEQKVAELLSALDAANFIQVPVTHYVAAGAMAGISVNCPAGTTLRTWSYNIRGYPSDPVFISNDYPRPDLSGYFVRAHGGALGGYVDLLIACGGEIIDY